MAKANLETLISKTEKAKAAYEAATVELEAALEDLPLGHVFTIGSIPYQVNDVKGKRKAQCMLSKRAIAAMKGEEVPPMAVRKRRTKAEIEADKAQAAQ